MHRINSINVSMNAVQSPIQCDSYLGCVVVLVRREEKERGKEGERRGGEMPSFVMFTPLALSD